MLDFLALRLPFLSWEAATLDAPANRFGAFRCHEAAAVLEFDFTLGPLRLRLTLATPTDTDAAGEYLTDSELADDDSDAPMGFRR